MDAALQQRYPFIYQQFTLTPWIESFLGRSTDQLLALGEHRIVMSSKFLTVAHISEVPEGGQLRIELEDKEILLCHHEGEIFALDYYCSHDHLGLEGGTFEGGAIVCPYHGAEFCLRTGDVKAGPAWEAIDTYPVKIEDDVIVLVETSQ
ncbi:MAG: Rieske (2Fe-2S) protein [Pseudomonadales bacterium]